MDENEYMNEVDEQEDWIIYKLGPEEALYAITEALDYDTKADIYSYIIRTYEL